MEETKYKKVENRNEIPPVLQSILTKHILLAALFFIIGVVTSFIFYDGSIKSILVLLIMGTLTAGLIMLRREVYKKVILKGNYIIKEGLVVDGEKGYLNQDYHPNFSRKVTSIVVENQDEIFMLMLTKKTTVPNDVYIRVYLRNEQRLKKNGMDYYSQYIALEVLPVPEEKGESDETSI